MNEIDIRKELGESVAWDHNFCQFNFISVTELVEVANAYSRDYGIKWKSEDSEQFRRFRKFGDLEMSYGAKFDVCMSKKTSSVHFLNFEEIGSVRFQSFGNSNLELFVESFKIVQAVFEPPVIRPVTNKLLRALVDVVGVDLRVDEDAFWWNFAASLLDMDWD